MNTKNEVFEYLIDQLRQQVSNNPYKRQCEDLAHEVQSLKNQLRDMSELVGELQRELAFVAGDASEYIAAEQSGCHKEDTQECEHDWCFYDTSASLMCRKCGLKK